jgi:hypothetical protein
MEHAEDLINLKKNVTYAQSCCGWTGGVRTSFSLISSGNNINQQKQATHYLCTEGTHAW